MSLYQDIPQQLEEACNELRWRGYSEVKGEIPRRLVAEDDPNDAEISVHLYQNTWLHLWCNVNRKRWVIHLRRSGSLCGEHSHRAGEGVELGLACFEAIEALRASLRAACF